MSYNTVSIIKDVDGNPVPQFYNKVTGQFQALEGMQGASKSILYDVDGNSIDLVQLIEDIVTILNNNNLPTGASTSLKQEQLKVIMQNIYNVDKTQTIYGESTETKPTSNMIKGNKYFEIDTTDVYMFNGRRWVKI